MNTLTFKQTTTSTENRLVTTRSYDSLNRLTVISSTAYGSSAPTLPASFSHAYNPASQRSSITNLDGSRCVYTYDALGQVTSGKKYWGVGTLVAGQNLEYTFDEIGNRDTTGGRASAASDYATANRLNQYPSRSVAGTIDVLGLANPTANVTVKV